MGSINEEQQQPVAVDSCTEMLLPQLGDKFKLLKSTNQIKELQTIIRDTATSRSDFKFVADRLIRMVIEEGLNQLPYTDCEAGSIFCLETHIPPSYLQPSSRFIPFSWIFFCVFFLPINVFPI
jgi:hypothetical protein